MIGTYDQQFYVGGRGFIVIDTYHQQFYVSGCGFIVIDTYNQQFYVSGRGFPMRSRSAWCQPCDVATADNSASWCALPTLLQSRNPTSVPYETISGLICIEV